MSDIKPESELFTIAEAARFLRLHRRTVERACTRGELPAQKVGRRWRIAKAALMEHLLGPFGRSSPALRPELDDFTLRGKPRKRRAPIAHGKNINSGA